MVGSMLFTVSTSMPAPRMVTALVMSTPANEPDDRVMTSPWAEAA